MASIDCSCAYIIQCKGLFTHTLRCALLRCANKNACVFTSTAQHRAAQRMCEQPPIHGVVTWPRR